MSFMAFFSTNDLPGRMVHGPIESRQIAPVIAQVQGWPQQSGTAFGQRLPVRFATG
jgi:hypothetical protein